MRYKLIKDNDKFRILNSKKFIYYNSLPNPDGSEPKNKTIRTSRGVISTKILTDGKIKSITDLDSNEFVLPKHLGIVEADVKEVKDLELIDHNYVIRILMQIECRKFNKGEGLFEVIKDIEVYIKNQKDKETLRNVKTTLNLIYNYKIMPNKQNISYNEIDANVYQLVK